MCGRLAESPSAIADAICEVISARSQWRAQRGVIRSRVAELSLAAWIEQNLSLAQELAGQVGVHEVA
jgi:hypothetical protein